MRDKSNVWQLSIFFSWPFPRLMVFVCSFFIFETLASAQEQVRLPPTKDILDRTHFHQMLLNRALNLEASTDRSVDLVFLDSDLPLGSDRRAKMLIQGRLDILWAPPRTDLENGALRVNFPFLRGLQGYRILLAHRDKLEALEQITGLETLKRLKAGLGSGWTDTAVFRENGLTTMTAPSLDTLWHMLQAERFDYLPRGLTEVIPELKSRQSRFRSVTMDRSLVLYYPFPLFFYVSKHRPDLHATLTANLAKLRQSGEFEALWREAHQEVLQELNFGDRKVLELNTSHLSVIKGEWPIDMLVSPEELSHLSR